LTCCFVTMVARLLCALLFSLCTSLQALEARTPENQVFQFMHSATFEYAREDVVKSTAYLWIPEQCEQLRGLLLMGQNIPEHGLVGHPSIRQACAENSLGIVWFTPRFMSVKTLNDADKMVAFLQQFLDALAMKSGYDEVATVPWLPMGESMHLRMVYHLLNAAPQRCIAAICIKNALSLTLCHNRETPVLVAVGTAQEWFQNEADIRVKWQDLSFYGTFLHERKKHPAWPVSILAEGSSGHFDCTDAMIAHFAHYISAASKARLPEQPNLPLRKPQGVEAGLPLPGYENAETKAWYFNDELSKDAANITSINWKAQSQLPAFLDAEGKTVPFAYQGVAKPVPIYPGEDGITFEVKGHMLATLPAGFIGAGEPLAVGPGAPTVEWVCGPVSPLGGGSFRIALDRTWPQCPAVVVLRHPGTADIRAVVQPGYLDLTPNSSGQDQIIAFDPIANVPAGTKSIPLTAQSTSGLAVRFFVKAGPAIVVDNTLQLTAIPKRSRFPIEVTVTAWQWGRKVEPGIKQAASVTRTFHILHLNTPATRKIERTPP
jgi:hypothetical protein